MARYVGSQHNRNPTPHRMTKAKKKVAASIGRRPKSRFESKGEKQIRWYLPGPGLLPRETHRHAGDTANNLCIAWIGKLAYLTLRSRVRNGQQMAIANLTPTANVRVS